jgi:hypothetical protein
MPRCRNEWANAGQTGVVCVQHALAVRRLWWKLGVRCVGHAGIVACAPGHGQDELSNWAKPCLDARRLSWLPASTEDRCPAPRLTPSHTDRAADGRRPRLMLEVTSSAGDVPGGRTEYAVPLAHIGGAPCLTVVAGRSWRRQSPLTFFCAAGVIDWDRFVSMIKRRCDARLCLTRSRAPSCTEQLG